MAALTIALLLLGGAGPAWPQVLGDLNGDGVIDAVDVGLLVTVYATDSADPGYDAGGDLNSDGLINFQDLAILSGNAGQTPTAVAPATVFLTANDIPDEFNDVLAVPESGFSLDFRIANPPGAPLIDLPSLSVMATQPAGLLSAGAELAPLFTKTPSGGSWRVSAVEAFPPVNVFFSFSIQNQKGDVFSIPSYGLASREWKITPPVGAGQKVFLDFDQDRDAVGGNDFDEDLRAFGLGSLVFPSLSALVRTDVVVRILEIIRSFYGQDPAGTFLPDSATVAFSDLFTLGATRICVGGEDPLGGTAFGLTPFDMNNAATGSDTCFIGSPWGVFPREFLFFQANSNFQAVFNPLRASAGGTPVGEDPLDATVLASGFDPGSALPAELARWNTINAGVETFARFAGVIAAHENGHTLGLTAATAAPAGLWGDGAFHNMTSMGGTPAENWMMNSGGSFNYEEIVGEAGEPLPRFRDLSDAYLRNELMLKSGITGPLQPAPTLTNVLPNPAIYSAGTVNITVFGSGFFGTPDVLLLKDGFPPRVVQNVLLGMPPTCPVGTCITGTLVQFQVGTGLFDVLVETPDDQSVVIEDHLTVQ
ncbi:MAG: hypothetical protein Q8R92_12705 [Deltaproteobacteria bacterium]|nr:hypothetical protein [Deltaproteobacteria bacterium]